MRRVVALCAALVVASAWGAPARAAGTVTAVLPVSGSADVASRTLVATAIHTAVADLDGFVAQPRAETDAVIATARSLGMACSLDDASCIVRTGGLAGAAVVIAGRLDDAPSTLRLRAFDIVTLKPRGDGVSVAITLPTSAQALSSTVGLAVLRLLAPERERGRLRIMVTPPGSTVVVDRVPRGTAPLAGPIEVPPGRHEVWAGKVGFDSASQTVDVAFDQEVAVGMDLAVDQDVAASSSRLTLPGDDPAATTSTTTTRGLLASKKPMRIAVYDVEGAQLPPQVPRLVQSGMLAELRKLDGVIVVGMDEIRQMLDREAQRELVGCSDNSSCLSGVAEALGADTIVVTALSKVGEQSVFSARRLDANSVAVVHEVVERLADDDGMEFLAVVGPAVATLFPERDLKSGLHRGVNDELALRLHPPPLDPWVFWTLGATAAVATVSTLGAGAWNQTSYAALAKSGDDAITDGATRSALEDDVRTSGLVFWAGAATAVTLATATGVVSLFVDWGGVRAANAAIPGGE
jgi:hypothetical protein